MVKIRLTRTGRKNAPSYRIVVTDSESKRDGKFIEIIGYYNPTENVKNVEYKKDRYDYWVGVGAQPSKTVTKLIKGTYKYEPYTRQNEKKGKEEIPPVQGESPVSDAPEQPSEQTENTDK